VILEGRVTDGQKHSDQGLDPARILNCSQDISRFLSEDLRTRGRALQGNDQWLNGRFPNLNQSLDRLLCT